MRFFLDEGVTVSAGRALQAAGHEVIFFNDSGLAKAADDPVVCIAAEASDAVLVFTDRDMRTLAKGHGVTPARFRALSLLHLKCREANTPARITAAMSLIEHEWQKGEGRERRFHVVIGDEVIRTHR
jgi:predicted nuclease of predicted toxin-antitoxin system